MLHERISRLLLPALLLSCLTVVACDSPPEPAAQSPSAGAGEQSASDESLDPELDALSTSSSCGGKDQACCGSKRAQSFKTLAKRCKAKHTVCPQSESSDICEPCGLVNQPCCIVHNKPSCRDGSTCAHSVPGGKGQDAGSGICI
jgi:hypothetical protein